ncbi:hypothetical protein F5Y19DRAFT_425206 [Xylariaceae sp. FL1651]|nr:hypothetical protein F5Y19DRAFT_425206 [Xylariaceae sp. FL1651]
MTKPWDLHEATIKKLYAEHTLSVVRQIMIEKHNFKASTRAYRGRLIRWGVRKYNCRRRNECGSISASSVDDSTTGSTTASPILSQPTVEPTHDVARYPGVAYTKDSESRIPNQLDRSYNAMDIDTSRTYPGSYGKNRTAISPGHEVQYGWSVSTTQSVTSPTAFSHTEITGGTTPYYGYPPLSPPMSVYPSATYDSDQTDLYRRQSFPSMPSSHNSTIHSNLPYSPVRGYGHGHATTRIGSIDSIRDQDIKRSPTG